MSNDDGRRAVFAEISQMPDGGSVRFFGKCRSRGGKVAAMTWTVHRYGDTYSLLPERPDIFGHVGITVDGFRDLLLYLVGAPTPQSAKFIEPAPVE